MAGAYGRLPHLLNADERDPLMAPMSTHKAKITRIRTAEHVVRTADGRFIGIRLTRKLAMAAMCTECLGFEENPTDCTSPYCPLFPYRAKTLATRRGNITKTELDAQKAKN